MGCGQSSQGSDKDKEANAEDVVEDTEVSDIESGRPVETQKVHDKQGSTDNTTPTLPGAMPIPDTDNPLDNPLDNQRRKLPPILHPVGKIG